ncbi:MAG TPA: low molecular weight phosphotyrosine protein phosphatase [Thiolapillus brandeum]|uniref:protein-tyrosine-phosphatase n=1 Tax=Thiolapillus brandeum TaxID=1076588 RepID=A0A831RVP1_9GAMM|nr:low molecular weight phosphotyrosine protein phosphatase [Thiolapillus brandeum]
MSKASSVSVLFVCMGNICRSPTAHGVFRKIVRDEGLDSLIEIDSAGTHAYHVGSPPDSRAQATALSRNLDLSDLRGRQVETEDFQRFDYVLAMDKENMDILNQLCPAGAEEKLRLFMDYAPDYGIPEVPDPYYGGDRGFEQVFDMIEEASRGLLEDIRQRHLS